MRKVIYSGASVVTVPAKDTRWGLGGAKGVVVHVSIYVNEARNGEERDDGSKRVKNRECVEVTAGLGGLCFGEIEEGKGRGFDGTLRLSTLAMVVIFLHAAFPVLIDFHFVLVFLNNNDGYPIVRVHVYSPYLDLSNLLVLLDLWLCRVFGHLCDLRPWLPIDRQFPLLVGTLLSRAWCMLVSNVPRYLSIFGP
ncbi:hypothetical protein TIFTF001_021942 [Ficus carica]|uniref:Uncharacterized protein n=1 Tax=Ficus carica TaxID=3494 RepID=A0AA88AGU7_FICCA|nr:hypothetical protein TIFTF001_021942 [Ficus carica]